MDRLNISMVSENLNDKLFKIVDCILFKLFKTTNRYLINMKFILS